VGNPNLTPKLPWAQKDFVSVALITVATNVVAVHPSVPANNLSEFITYLKANPGKLSYASQGNGSLSHIGTEMFKLQTKTSMVHIPYRGSGPALQDVLSGQVQVFITTPPSVMGQIQAGKLKGLAVAGKSRHPGLPSVPTTAEAGLKGFELEAWVGIFAPAGTPADVVAKLSGQIKAALDLPETKTRADAAGVELRYMAPAALDALVKKDTEFWAKTIQSAGIKPE
jgi:tripartite-type tricarboxylate transporter receptor subunit TctC